MRTVPVILHSQLLESLQMILKYRNDAKVPSKNPFLFGIPNDNKKRIKYLRACALLRKFSGECGAKLPHALRGTQLRKHIATCCITLNLSEDQVGDLANFMGHDKNIHKSHYRQPIPELEILRITKLLEVAQGGTEEENEENKDINDDYYNDNDDESNDSHDDESNVENEENNIIKSGNSSTKKCIKKQSRNISVDSIQVDNNRKRRSSKLQIFIVLQAYRICLIIVT